MLIVADVHAEFAALTELGKRRQPLLILGDLVNFIDYRTNKGIISQVLGRDIVRQMVAHRGRGDYQASRRLWERETEGREQEVRTRIGALVGDQYGELSKALSGIKSYVTFGNVDWPDLLRQSLPATAQFVDGDIVEIGRLSVGFVGGGPPSPLGVPGEVGEEELSAKLEKVGGVDILCSHMAPAIDALAYDVIAGRPQHASRALADHVGRHQPAFHYFGDIHQPQATEWRIGKTRCINVGYFRATKRAWEHVSGG